jgi:hypothetical protein
MRIIIIFLCLFLIGCENKERLFYDVISKIEDSLPKKELAKFSKEDERIAVKDFQLTYGLIFIKSESDSIMVKYLNSKGLYDDNDISNIVFTSLHRKLNLKNINLNQQIENKIKYLKFFKERKKLRKECKKLKKTRFIKNNKYVIGDTVQIRMMINKMDNRAYPIECINMYPDWKFDDKKDLLIKGVVLNKYKYDYIEENKFMKIKVLEINKKNILSPMRIINVGDEYEVVLNYEIIEPAPRQSEH